MRTLNCIPCAYLLHHIQSQKPITPLSSGDMMKNDQISHAVIHTTSWDIYCEYSSRQIPFFWSSQTIFKEAESYTLFHELKCRYWLPAFCSGFIQHSKWNSKTLNPLQENRILFLTWYQELTFRPRVLFFDCKTHSSSSSSCLGVPWSFSPPSSLARDSQSTDPWAGPRVLQGNLQISSLVLSKTVTAPPHPKTIAHKTSAVHIEPQYPNPHIILIPKTSIQCVIMLTGYIIKEDIQIILGNKVLYVCVLFFLHC